MAHIYIYIYIFTYIYICCSFIRSTKTNALRRNSENPPKDHQHSSSIKRPCILPLNGKVTELEIINAGLKMKSGKNKS